MLKGEKIKLRPVEPEDLDLLMLWENDPPNWEVSGTITPYSRDILKRYIKNADQDIYRAGQLRLMIEDRHQRTIGTIDVFEFDPFHQRAGIGILIADPVHRNNGYASESLRLIKQYCFEHLGLHQLFCNILEGNEASIHLFEKAGFTITGSRKQWIRSGSKFKDQLFLQLFREE